MTDPLTSEERILRGREAERMLSDGSVLNQAIAAVNASMMKQVIAGKTPEEREEARSVIIGLGAIASQLAVYASDVPVEEARHEADK